MTTAYTSLLGLALPVTGELSGTWGNTVNTEITALLDSAVAGTTTISADADITLTTTTGAANESREAILLWTAGGTVTRNITAPAQSKAYIVINKSSNTQSIVLRGVGPTTGVTIVVNEKAVCAWNGSDFVKVASSAISNLTGTLPVANGGTGVTTSTGTTNVVLSNSPTLVTPALGTPSALVGTNITGTASGLTAGNVTTNANLTGAVTSVGNATSLGSFTSAQLSGALTDETGSGSAVFATSPTLVTPILGTPTSGTLTNCTFPTLNQNTTGTAAGLSTTLAVASGGTGLTTTPANGALDIGNGTGFTRTTLTAGSGVSITNSAGGISIAATGSGGSVTSVAATVPTFLSVAGSPITTSGTLAISLSGTALPVLNGGTGVTTSTGTGNVVLSTSPTLVTPILGTPTSGTLTNCTFPTLNQNTTGTAANVTGIVAVVNGGTGTATPAIVAGTNVTVSGTWPNQTINSTASGTGTVTSVAATVPAFLSVTGSPITTAGTLAIGFSGTALPVVNGGTGTTTPSIVAGTNVTVTGTWPNQTIAASGGGSATLTIVNKTAAYTVVAGDLGKVINCTSNLFTISLTAAATLGAGFNVTIWNTSTSDGDAVTIDPAGSETIDGLTTLIIRPGEGMQIVCNGTNWDTGDKKVMRAYAENNFNTRPIASGNFSLALGGLSGVASEATSTYSLAIFGSSTSARSSAIGLNSAADRAVTATGSGAMALGGSYASGADSFAAAVVNNTSTYGAQGANSIAIGVNASSTGGSGVAIGRSTLASGGLGAVAIGGYGGTTASGDGSIAIGGGYSGNGAVAAVQGSVAINDYAHVPTTKGKYAFTSSGSFAQGASQTGMVVLRRATTNATASTLGSDGAAGGSDNQLILPNNSAFAFTGTVVARQQAAGGTQAAAFKVEGLIRREGTAASTTLVASTVTAISNVPAWVIALTADTTNGGLAVTATGAASTNIRWVATINTSEVIYA